MYLSKKFTGNVEMKKLLKNNEIMQNLKRKKLTPKKINDLLRLFKYILAQKGEAKIDVLKYLDERGIDNISESIYNLLYNENLNHILTKSQKSKLVKTIKSNLSNFENIARKKIPSKIRKRKIIQSGTGIGTILLTLLPVISSLLFKK